MKRVNAPPSRGCSTTAPDTLADGETGPSCVAPRGIRGLGATTLVPVGAAAPAPAAEVAKQSNAKSGAATSARRLTNRFIYVLLNRTATAAPKCVPDPSAFRKSETRCLLRR